MYVQDRIVIRGRKALPALTLSTSVARTTALPGGLYDYNAGVDSWLRVSKYVESDPDLIYSALTAVNGYLVKANNTVTVHIEDGDCIASIAGGAGSASIHQVG